jgi:oligopeptidase A
MSGNPLMHDVFPIPFDRVRPAHVADAVDALLADAQQRMDGLAKLEAEPTFENTMLALEAITESLGRAMRVVGHLEAVATSDDLRNAYNEAQPRVSAFASKIPLSAGLWQAIQQYAGSDDAKQLKGSRKRFFEKTVAYFKRQGAQLDAEGKKRLAQVDVELTKLTLRYSQNVLDSTNAFALYIEDESELAGLPESAREAARQSAEAKGKAGWRFTLQAPSYIPLMKYLEDASIRERMYRAMCTRATTGEHDNRPIVEQVLALRNERAQLLGYASFADLVLEDRMAKNAAAARTFIEDLTQRTLPQFEIEKQQLGAFRRSLEGDDAPPMSAWDIGFYAQKQRLALYNIDDEVLRPYFAFERVLNGLFQIAQRIYGVSFEPWADAPRWADGVRAYRVLDENGDWLAGIYVDPFPRETKQAGAWMDGLLSRSRLEEDTRHIGVIVANLTPPLGKRDAHLTHGDVETTFHEFGHLMHHCLSRAELRTQAGTHVAWDFVELPSQILENWCWERDALDLFARHDEDDSPIPEELLDAMQKSRTYRAASNQMRQLGFATADLAMHVDFDAARDGDPTAYARAIMERFAPTPLPEDHAMIAAFDHLFGAPVGYAAAYYSYKWAEVLDADAFTRFKERGVFDRETGRAFRDRILARGDEEDPAELFKSFMGRAPKLDALLDRLGIGDST